MKTNPKNFLAAVLFFIFCSAPPLGAETKNFGPRSPVELKHNFSFGDTAPGRRAPALTAPIPSAGVEDVSDRNYFFKVRQMIGMAHESIDVSAADFAFEGGPKDPMGVLIQDLMSAAKRDIKVRLFLNTRGTSYQTSLFLRQDVLEDLRGAGIQVHFVSPNVTVNDHLVIVDQNLVLDGGLPWTREGIEEGLGSATLSYSTALAQKKRTRLELFPLWDIEAQRDERAAGALPVPLFLIREFKYFSSMVTHDDGDAMKIYLALLRNFYSMQQAGQTVAFEDLVQEIPADQYFERGAVTFQTLKTLQRLESEYGLLKIEKEEPDRVQLRLNLPSALTPAVSVPLAFFQEGYAKGFSPRAIFAYIVIRYRLQMSGDSPVWLGSEHNVEQDFPMTSANFRLAVTELRRQNLIEVFPFEMKSSRKGERAEREYRYLANPVASLSERLEVWSRLRDQFGDDDFKKAREMAELLGEPEDPKVVVTFTQLLKEFPAESVQTFTQHVASLAPESTPAELDYLRALLEHENQGASGLVTV